MSAFCNRLKLLMQDENGQTMVEYVMLIVLVALAVFILSPNIKDAILKVFSEHFERVEISPDLVVAER